MNSREWRMFSLKDLFTVKKGTRLTIADRIEGNIPFVTAGHDNQGVSSFIGNKELDIFHDVITIDMFSEAFYRDYSFCCDDNVHVLIPNEDEDIGKYASLFIVGIINSTNILSYGKQYRLKTFQRHKILMPINEKGKPDYGFMEEYMREKERKLLDKYLNYLKSRNKEEKGERERERERESFDLTSIEWDSFFISDVFDYIQRGKRLIKRRFIDGNTPYISSSSLNNGIDGFIGNKKNVRIFDNCLTIANSGSVGCTFYHPYEFIASDHVTHFKNDEFNKYVYLFIATVLEQLKSKYSFNREINDKRLKNEIIYLPINDEGNPDYEFMEQYMINIEIKLLEKYKQYLEQNV